MEERIPLKNITDEHADAFADICKFKKDQPKSPLQNAIDRKAEVRRILTDEKTGSHFMGEWRNLIEGLKFLYINGYDIPLFYNITASPPSMPDISDEAINERANKIQLDYERIGFVWGAKWMRSQCDVKQKAVEFAEWIEYGEYTLGGDNLWYKWHEVVPEPKGYTTEELYEIFNQQER